MKRLILPLFLILFFASESFASSYYSSLYLDLERDKYYEASTAARSDILDTVAEYAVLIEKNEKERIFVMLNSWHDPLFTKAYPLDQPIYDLVW